MTGRLGRLHHAGCLPPEQYLPGWAASMISNAERAGLRRGITLTEVLISILILGVGLVSLATLFPIGLLRLREAQRQSRSAYLFESATADTAARGLFSTNSFAYADLLNVPPGLPVWFPNSTSPSLPNGYDPLTQDAAAYGPYIPYLPPPNSNPNQGVSVSQSAGYGLPFAYDPLWRYQTGIYPDWANALGLNMPEARFASGIASLLRQDTDGVTTTPSAHGLQRLTNFNRPSYTNALGTTFSVMPAATQVPWIFVSQEDIVWQGATTSSIWPYGAAQSTTVSGQFSPVLPDLGLTQQDALGNPILTQDWRFSWMITAQQTNTFNAASFDGNIVVFENRQFAVDPSTGQAAGETVYEGVFGFSSKVLPVGRPGYGAGADRTVLIRWSASQTDPVVKVGDWIADVTYERSQQVVNNRFINAAVANPLNNGEWDNLPAQRCFWYQVQKVTPAGPDPNTNLAGGPYRSMVVYVNRKLDARTLLQGDGFGTPVYQNAVLVCPYVVNVIPQMFFVR